MSLSDRSVSIFMSVLVLSLAAAGQEKQPPKPVDGQAEMARHQAASKPGPGHEQLLKLAGSWTTTTKLLAEGMPNSETRGKAELKAVLGNRFLQEENRGEMMGMAYQGLRLWGYNAGLERYEAAWTWTNDTAMLNLSGTSSDGGKTITYEATLKQNEAAKPEKLTIVLRIVDADTFVVEIQGAEATMKTTYARTK